MANERIPEDPYRSTFDGDDLRNLTPLDNELRPDPELRRGSRQQRPNRDLRGRYRRVARRVFYGLNNSSINQAGTASTAQNAAPASPTENTAQPPRTTAQTSPTAAPPGMRDVTPHPNANPGVTTGAAPASPAESAGPNGGSNPTTAPAGK